MLRYTYINLLVFFSVLFIFLKIQFLESFRFNILLTIV